MITTRAWEGGPKEHRAKQKWPREIVPIVPNCSWYATGKCVGSILCSSFIPMKCFIWWKTDCIPMLSKIFYCLSTQTDCLLLPPLTGTWLEFKSGAITGVWYWIPAKLRLKWSVNPGLWTHSLLTWSCLGFKFELVTTSIFLVWSLTASSHNTKCGVLSLVSLKELVFLGWWSVSMDTSVLNCCYYVFVFPILEYYSPVWGSAAECHLKLLKHQEYSVECHLQLLECQV